MPRCPVTALIGPKRLTANPVVSAPLPANPAARGDAPGAEWPFRVAAQAGAPLLARPVDDPQGDSGERPPSKATPPFPTLTGTSTHWARPSTDSAYWQR